MPPSASAPTFSQPTFPVLDPLPLSSPPPQPMPGGASFSSATSVLLIGVDSIGADKLYTWVPPLPNLSVLLARDTYTDKCRGQFPTISLPNWATHLGDAGISQTGAFDNAWSSTCPLSKAKAYAVIGEVEPWGLVWPHTGQCNRWPMLTDALLQNAEHGIFVNGWNRLCGLFDTAAATAPGCGDYTCRTQGTRDWEQCDIDTVTGALDYLGSSANPAFTFVYLGNYDALRSLFGWGL